MTKISRFVSWKSLTFQVLSISYISKCTIECVASQCLSIRLKMVSWRAQIKCEIKRINEQKTSIQFTFDEEKTKTSEPWMNQTDNCVRWEVGRREELKTDGQNRNRTMHFTCEPRIIPNNESDCFVIETEVLFFLFFSLVLFCSL